MYDIHFCYKQESSNSYNEFNFFYNWLKETVEKNIIDIYSKNMSYLYDSAEELKVKMDKNFRNKNSLENVLKLSDIEFKNKDNFKEFLDHSKFEYNFMSKYTDEKDYEYYNNFISWSDMTQDYLEDVIDNLSKDEFEAYNINFEIVNLNDEKEYVTFKFGGK